MRFLCKLIGALSLLLIVSCGDESGECNNKPTEVSYLGWGYSGQEHYIEGEFACANSVSSVYVNGVKAKIIDQSKRRVRVKLPPNLTGIATLTLKLAGSREVAIGNILIYPGTFSWTEVSPLSVSSSGASFIANGKGYQFTTSTAQLYEYDPAANNWNLYAENTLFGNTPIAGFYLSNEFLFYADREKINSLDFTTKTISQVNDIHRVAHTGFVIGGEGYIVSSTYSSENTDIYTIEKYDPATKTLIDPLSKLLDDLTFLTCQFEYGGKEYIGVFYSTKGTELLEFDPVNYTLISKTWINHESLKLMGVKGYIAYFVSEGNNFVCYNFEQDEWKYLMADFPEPFQGLSSFTIDGQWYGGLGRNGLNVSNKYYKFEVN
jgi:hypothetical protein